MTLSISVLIPKSYLLYNSIHPTFSLGDFNATCITYRNLLVKDTQTGQSPTMLGPVFVHQSKSFEIYNLFCISTNWYQTRILAYGTDGEAAPVKAFK